MSRRRPEASQPAKESAFDPDLQLIDTPHGVLVPVYAQLGARRAGLMGKHAGRLKVAVTAVAEKGQANAAITEVLAAALNVKRTLVHLHSGQTSRQKTFLVQSLSLEDVRSRLHHCGSG